VLRGGDTPQGPIRPEVDGKKEKLTKICGYFFVCVAFLWSTIYLNKSNSKKLCLFVVLFFELKWLSSGPGHTFRCLFELFSIICWINSFCLWRWPAKDNIKDIRGLFDWFFFQSHFCGESLPKISTVPSAENSSKLDEWNFIYFF
jgi:hypothetical protein